MPLQPNFLLDCVLYIFVFTLEYKVTRKTPDLLEELNKGVLPPQVFFLSDKRYISVFFKKILKIRNAKIFGF